MELKITAFIWIQRFLHDLEKQGFYVVYLRNHENLPHDFGNDVDLLVSPTNLKESTELLVSHASSNGWKHLRTVEFGPWSLFFCNHDGSEFVHVDLFSSIDYHWLPYGDAKAIIERRQWNGRVFIPDPLDEILLNVSTRLFYQGVIREKHRQQAARILSEKDAVNLKDYACQHFGKPIADILVSRILEQQWKELESDTNKLRFLLFKNAVIQQTEMSLSALVRYIRRSLKRILSPPGPFIVFEGADGVGKSTLIENLLPIFKGITGRSDTLMFHWKPTRDSRRLAGDIAGAPSDPRGKQTRCALLSILFLTYHWLGFWTGYFRYVLPLRIKNRAVIGDRYAYEFFLDPVRLRLNLPQWMLRLAAMTTPQPDLVICMTADPSQIVQRKPELSVSEIDTYQHRLRGLVAKKGRCVELSAEGNPDTVTEKARDLMISSISN
jgi:thymidylate kinase